MSTAQVTFQQAPTGAEAPTADPTKDINATATNASASNPDGGANPDRPSWLPTQFTDGEALAKSYGDTRAELTRAQQELAKLRNGDGAEKPEGGTQGAAQTEAEKAAAAAVATAGLDVSQWQTEFNQTRDVSAEGRAKIAEGLKAKQAFGPDADYEGLVNDFIEGQKARVSNVETQLVTQAGGADNYNQMVGWAASNLNESEISTYNKAMGSGDFNAMSLAVDGLRARYERVNGSNPQLLSGDNTISNAGGGFASTFEMTQAMGDPRYRTDPVYRKQVEQRAMRSNF